MARLVSEHEAQLLKYTMPKAEAATGYAVWIQRNSDKVFRVYHYEFPWDVNGSSEYLWLDGGNYTCDCNRYRFFEWAAHGAMCEPGHHPCGHEAYTILKFVMPDGRERPGDEGK